MARPRKEGLDYFSHDTDAANDEKIYAIRSMFGNDGYAFYFILLERIYRTSVAELDISKPVLKSSAIKQVGISEEIFDQLLEASFDINLFDREEYVNRMVITSKGIKERFTEVQNKRGTWRKNKDKQELSSEFSAEKTVKETFEKTPQSKVKESKKKVNEIKDNTVDVYTSNSDLNNSIKDFIEFRKSIKKPMNLRAITLLLNQLTKLASSDEEKIEILEQSMLNGWQSVYELKSPRGLPRGPKQQVSYRQESEREVELYIRPVSGENHN